MKFAIAIALVGVLAVLTSSADASSLRGGHRGRHLRQPRFEYGDMLDLILAEIEKKKDCIETKGDKTHIQNVVNLYNMLTYDNLKQVINNHPTECSTLAKVLFDHQAWQTAQVQEAKNEIYNAVLEKVDHQPQDIRTSLDHCAEVAIKCYHNIQDPAVIAVASAINNNMVNAPRSLSPRYTEQEYKDAYQCVVTSQVTEVIQATEAAYLVGNALKDQDLKDYVPVLSAAIVKTCLEKKDFTCFGYERAASDIFKKILTHPNCVSLVAQDANLQTKLVKFAVSYKSCLHNFTPVA